MKKKLFIKIRNQRNHLFLSEFRRNEVLLWTYEAIKLGMIVKGNEKKLHTNNTIGNVV